MLFLVWLAVSFLVVAAINIYLRHFGLPRRQGLSSTINTDGKVSSQYYSSLGASSALHGLLSSPTHGESARWINSILAWIYQRTPSGGHKMELLDAWFKALTEQTDLHSREMRVRFDEVRGSMPEFSNISIDHSSGSTGALNVFVTVVAKDVTLQVCIVTPTVDSCRTVYCDVYLLHLQGQLKVAVSPSPTNNETAIHVSFTSAPELRIQILPSGRLDPSVDISSIEKIVRAALGGAVTKVTWSSAGGIRSSHVSITTPQNQHQSVTPSGQTSNQQSTYNTASQQNFIGNQTNTANYRDLPQQHISPNISQPQFSQPVYSQQQQLQQPVQQQPVQPVQQQQVHQQQQQMQYGAMSPSLSGNMPRTVDMATRPTNIPSLDTYNTATTRRLLVKVIKANGLADDLGSCNAYCLVRIDRPSQNFMTAVVRNTVNPMWDEQFVLEIDSFTSQIQFDILDRDKQPDCELLGKAVVQFDEIRRMPSSRQILPLTGRLRSRTATSGSVTVEFVFLDSADISRTPVNDNMNAVRMTSQQAMQPISATNSPVTSFNEPMKANVTSGDYNSAYQNRLSAHDLALSQQVSGSRQQESPSVVVTGTEFQRTNNAQPQGTLDGRGRGQTKESFASALKKRLSRGGGKKRSQSADRAQPHSQSLHEGSSYLRPPGDSMQGYRTTDALDASADQKARSNSFTSSLRRIFKPSTTGASGKKDISREGSLTRNQQTDSYQQQGYNYDRSLRHSTPVPPGAEHRDQYRAGLNVTPGAERRNVDQFGNTLSTTTQGTLSAQGTLNTQATLSAGRY